jgi:hypothetical protein
MGRGKTKTVIPPAGARGATGPQGIQGPIGPEGPPGSGGTVDWGDVGGVLADQIDLDTALAGKAATVHTHVLADTTGLVAALAGKAATAHTHAPADVTGTAVITTDARLSDARTPLAHVHPQSDVTGLAASLAAKQDVLVSGTNIKTINGASVVGAGDLVVTGALPDLVVTKLSATANQTIAAGYGAIVPDEYEIANTVEVEIANGGILEIS